MPATLRHGIDTADVQITDNDLQIIVKIANRAVHYLKANSIAPDVSQLDIVMDVGMAHQRVPLDLHALHDASDRDFTHDVFGISRHLNRETGDMNAFTPRYAARPAPSAEELAVGVVPV